MRDVLERLKAEISAEKIPRKERLQHSSRVKENLSYYNKGLNRALEILSRVEVQHE